MNFVKSGVDKKTWLVGKFKYKEKVTSFGKWHENKSKRCDVGLTKFLS